MPSEFIPQLGTKPKRQESAPRSKLIDNFLRKFVEGIYIKCYLCDLSKTHQPNNQAHVLDDAFLVGAFPKKRVH